MLEAELQFWESYLRAGSWVAGESLTLADFSVFTYVATAVQLGLELEPAFPKVSNHYRRLCERPSVKKTWPQTWARGRSDLLAPP